MMNSNLIISTHNTSISSYKTQNYEFNTEKKLINLDSNYFLREENISMVTWHFFSDKWF